MKRSPSSPSSPEHKSSRTTSKPAESSLLCTLPPTCNTKPTVLANTQELEVHYAKYHAWVCQASKSTNGICGNVFPDARLLELHHTECHDPIAAVRKERGEKIFACFLLPSICTKVFLTPKARRLHLIAVHGYPKEYFFAVVNKGVGGLLAKWGDGAGMIRGKWKSRSKDEEHDGKKDKEHVEDEDEEDQEDSEGTTNEEDSEYSSEPETNTTDKRFNNGQLSSMDMDIDALTTSFQSSLSVSNVPSSIRFGRGARRGSRGGRAMNSITSNAHRYHLSDRNESTIDTPPKRGRGGFRGRRGIRGGSAVS
ncbi:hypothetical protein DFH05DRAFT_1528963 [Lentinula detonsa]|uniref:C2H2-type domain-containing protein n=1 Tax=Lentinula detonsa TaxID=2804962 RepID=A0A9W8NTG1_9AGAR|nr:hypothetical protein DFH05DRAFT_1528963 [Lentinula detonsa]